MKPILDEAQALALVHVPDAISLEDALLEDARRRFEVLEAVKPPEGLAAELTEAIEKASAVPDGLPANLARPKNRHEWRALDAWMRDVAKKKRAYEARITAKAEAKGIRVVGTWRP